MHAAITLHQGQIPGNIAPSLSETLLLHDGLMTPVLKRNFGRIFVTEKAAIEEGDVYRRRSTIKQWASGHVLLDADLVINTAALPSTVISLLRSTSTPFGEMLSDHGFDVRLDGLSPIRRGTPTGVRKGRRHTMTLATSGIDLCRVQELLAPEPELMKARAFYLQGGQGK